MSQPWKEQEESATRNGGNERVGNMASRASGSQRGFATDGSWERVEFSNGSTSEGDGE